MTDYQISVLYVSIVKLLAALVGTALSVLGYKLFVGGVSGSSSLIADAGKQMRLRLMNASPGLFFLLAGAALAIGVLMKTEVQLVRDPQGNRAETATLKGDEKIADVLNGIAWMLSLEARELRTNTELRKTKLELASVLVGVALEKKPGEKNFLDTQRTIINLLEAKR